MNTRELFGKEMVGEQGSKIGRVKDLIFDSATWQVKALEVELAGNVAEEFGMKRMLRSTLVPVKIEDIRGVGDVITLKISKPQLQKISEPPREEKTDVVERA